MTTSNDDEDARKHEDDDSARGWTGDEEAENREQIEQTGEPKRDALGNAEGAS